MKVHHLFVGFAVCCSLLACGGGRSPSKSAGIAGGRDNGTIISTGGNFGDHSTGGAGGLDTGSGGTLGMGGAGAWGTGGASPWGMGGAEGVFAGGAGGPAVTPTTDGGAKEDARAMPSDRASATMDSPLNPESCPAFVPCGGNLVGAWHMKAECSPPYYSPGDCVFRDVFDLSGYDLEYKFAVNGTYTAIANGVSSQRLSYSKGCFSVDGGSAVSCFALDENIRRSFDMITDAGTLPVIVQKAGCVSDSTGGCLCDESVAYVSRFSYGGTYISRGNQLTLLGYSDAHDGSPAELVSSVTWDYCVSGNTLAIKVALSDGYLLTTYVR